MRFLFFTLIASTGYSAPAWDSLPRTAPILASVNQRLIHLEKAAGKLQPALTTAQRRELARAVFDASRSHNIPPKVLLSILFKESSLRIDPQNCRQNMAACKDLGIAQINWDVWGKELGLNKYRLVSEYGYSANVAARILAIYKKRYQDRFPRSWQSFYHTGTPGIRQAYDAAIRRIYRRLSEDT